MDNNQTDRSHMEGRLPPLAPLATPYVPFQQEDPMKYEPRKALIRGTLYPGLDLPFMGMVNQREKAQTPRNQLQTLAFVLQELALYLDTHPEDMQALAQYREYQQRYDESLMEYSKDHGPMTHYTPVTAETYTWLKDPWPWDINGNKEG